MIAINGKEYKISQFSTLFTVNSGDEVLRVDPVPYIEVVDAGRVSSEYSPLQGENMQEKANKEMNANINNKEENGWVDLPPKAGGGAYGKYTNQLVILVSTSQACYVYLPRVVMEALDSPKFIKVRARGSNIRFFKSDVKGGAFTVQRDHKGGSLPYISLTAIVKSNNIAPGVYQAHIESGGIVFDTRQKPGDL